MRFAATLALTLCGTVGIAPPRELPPNIIVVLADDLGVGDLGCYGQAKIHTPSIDALAASGMRFTAAYAPAPVCAPTRCMLITGRDAGHAQIRDNHEEPREGQLPLAAGTTTIATLLHAQGYATAIIGKWGLGGPASTGVPTKQGFDFFYGFLCQRKAHDHYPRELWRNETREPLPQNAEATPAGRVHAQQRFTEESIAFIDANKDRPFFLLLACTIPHLALQVDAADLAQYSGAFPETPYIGEKGYLANTTPRATYAAMITRMDRDVGRIVEALRDRALDRRTLIIVASDNGAAGPVGGADCAFFNSYAGLRGHKGTLFEGGIRVPLIANWPGVIAPNSICATPAALYDLMPTCVDVAGGGVPHEIEGLSLAPILRGKSSDSTPVVAREALYFEFPSSGGQQALRIGRYKALRRGLNRGNLSIALYDLEKDPAETTDIAASLPEIVARASQLFIDGREASRGFPLATIDALTPPAGMRFIPGGEFDMGSAPGDAHARGDELPRHRVRLAPYFIDETEVTNAQFAKFVDATNYKTIAERPVDWNEMKKQVPPGTPAPAPELLQPGALVFTPPKSVAGLVDYRQWWTWTIGADWRHPEGPQSNIDTRADHPVVHVSFDDALAYAAWAGKRLPTEAEWEFAARGSLAHAAYPWGNEMKPAGETRMNCWQGEFPTANTREDGFERTNPVRAFAANGYGLYGVAGNVWEWCSDVYDGGEYGERAAAMKPGEPVFNPQRLLKPGDDPSAAQRVHRGGSFLCHESYCSSYRVAARMSTSADSALSHLGFRCAMSVAQPSK